MSFRRLARPSRLSRLPRLLYPLSLRCLPRLLRLPRLLHPSRVSAVCVAGVAALVAAGCHGKAPQQAPPPPQVAVVTVTPRPVPESYEFSGEVVPYRRVEVRARVDGVIEARTFREGSVVQAGEVLYRLDQVRYEAAYRSALARFENARRTLARLEPLLPQHAVAQQDVDNARSEYEASRGALDQAKKDLDDTTVRAGMTGRIGNTNLDVGGRVTGPADLLTTIDRLDPVYVTFRPSSDQLLEWKSSAADRALIQPGSPLKVEIVLPSGETFPRTGRLDYVAPSLDPSTGTQEFRARFTNPDRLLLPGQFVRVRLVGFVRDSALAVPQRAVQSALGRQFVYVVGKGDTVASRDVHPGPWSGDLWIIDQGLSAGERVIVDGAQKVGPGAVAKPVPFSADSAAPAIKSPAPVGANR